MKVRITKAYSPFAWYSNLIGKVFDVEEDGVEYWNEAAAGWFIKDDCQLVLDHKVFDDIYERCDKDTGRDDTACLHHFSSYVLKHNRSLFDQYERDVSFRGLNRNLMAAYASGEIRDAGPYMQPLNIRKHKDDAIDAISRIPEFITTHMGVDWAKSDDWYKLDPVVFDKLVDRPFWFAMTCYGKRHDVWELANAIFPQEEYESGIPRGELLIHFYKKGILRKGGAMPDKPDYSDVFYWDGDTLKADWSKVEVTKENALELSKEGWRQYVAELESRGRVLDKANNSCALCELHNTWGDRCGECPIKNKTGKTGCDGTPWRKWWQAKHANLYRLALRYAKEMLKYLEAL